MPNTRIIPDSSKYTVVTFSILSEGKAIKPDIGIMSITVTKEVNRIPTAKIVVRDGNAAEENFKISETNDFIPGKKIEVKLGWGSKDATVFKGIITKHAIKAKAGGSVLVIECKDESVKLTIGRKNKYWEKKKDSDVIKELLKGNAGKVEATEVQHPELVQHYCTDWDFILSRADVNGLLAIPNDGKVDVTPPKTSGKEVLTLIYGANLYEFEAEMDARSQWKAVKSSSWSYKDQKIIDKKATSASFDEAGNIKGAELSKVIGLAEYELQHSGHVVKEELGAWAEACMLKSRLAKNCGRLKFKGFAKISPGDLVKLDGMGSRFNGKVYVTAIRHEVADGNWFTHAQFGLSPDWYYKQHEDVVDLPAAGLVPAISGLQIGKVVKLEKDPDGEHRIQVKLPIIDPQAKGVWARMASLDAGKERGYFFRPEIDDEVIVGFINGDPRDPVVLGMLHSSKLPAPIDAKDVNHEKGLVTRSKMRVWFDDEKKIMTLDTPAGNMMEISEDGKSITIEDQNKNKIVMNDKGIEINSPKDIKIVATGLISNKATKDFTAEGLKVGLKAKTEFKAEGAAGAKLETSAIAEIKGSLVKIN